MVTRGDVILISIAGAIVAGAIGYVAYALFGEKWY